VTDEERGFDVLGPLRLEDRDLVKEHWQARDGMAEYLRDQL